MSTRGRARGSFTIGGGGGRSKKRSKKKKCPHGYGCMFQNEHQHLSEYYHEARDLRSSKPYKGSGEARTTGVKGGSTVTKSGKKKVTRPRKKENKRALLAKASLRRVQKDASKKEIVDLDDEYQNEPDVVDLS